MVSLLRIYTFVFHGLSPIILAITDTGMYGMSASDWLLWYLILGTAILADSVFGPISKFMNEVMGYSKSLINEVSSTAYVVASASENLSSGAEEVNSSAEEVSSTSQAMSEGATTQTELISEVNTKIVNLKDLMDDIIRKIEMNTQEVSQIALQTNILALNAGIEASRAGDYGRGFAVVAENVRKLSDQSKMASERIEIVAREVNEAVLNSLNEISQIMLNVVSVSEETAASAEEVAAAAEEMTTTMEEVTASSLQLSTKAEESKLLLSKLKMS